MTWLPRWFALKILSSSLHWITRGSPQSCHEISYIHGENWRLPLVTALLQLQRNGLKRPGGSNGSNSTQKKPRRFDSSMIFSRLIMHLLGVSNFNPDLYFLGLTWTNEGENHSKPYWFIITHMSSHPFLAGKIRREHHSNLVTNPTVTISNPNYEIRPPHHPCIWPTGKSHHYSINIPSISINIPLTLHEYSHYIPA